MRTPLLTIAIPTFNRAKLLERQLQWLSRAIRGFGPECEVIISDNASPDATPEVIERFAEDFDGAQLRLVRQDTNLGAIRNIAFCFREACGRHVWTIGDDDLIEDDTLAYVLNVLREHPDLALLALNFSSRDVPTGELLFERCFDVKEEKVSNRGQMLFEKQLEEPHSARRGGLMFTTALVYRSELIQEAIEEWPEGLGNLAVQLYWTAYCAKRGPVLVTKETKLECAAGTHFFLEDHRLFHRIRYTDKPAVEAKLMEMGYDPGLCWERILGQSRGLFRLSFLKQCLRRWPFFTLKLLGRHLGVLGRAAVNVWSARLLGREHIHPR